MAKKKFINKKVANRMYRKHAKHDTTNFKVYRGGLRLV